MNGAEILGQATNESQGADPNKPSNQVTPDFDSKFAALAKMERNFRQKEQGWLEKEKGWGEKDRKLAEYEEIMKLMDENPLEAVKKRKGWGLQQLNEFAVQNSSDEDLDPVAQITKGFQTKMEEMKKALTEDFQKQIKEKEDGYAKRDQDHQINSFKSSIKSFLGENKDAYELANALSPEDDGTTGQELVFDVIYTDIQNRKAAYDKAIEEGDEVGEFDSTPLDFKAAADKVEAYLDAKINKFVNLNKVKSKFTPNDQFDISKVIQSPKTMTNSFTPQSQTLDESNPEVRKKRAEDLVKSWIS